MAACRCCRLCREAVSGKNFFTLNLARLRAPPERHGVCLLFREPFREASMSVTAASSASLNPALAAMLSQLTAASGAATPPMPSAASAAPSSASAAAPVTGSGKAQVSDAILDLFSKMHQASGAAHHGGGAGGSSGASGSTTTASTASTMIDPLNQLLAAIDSDEDEFSAQAQSSDPDFTALLSTAG